MENGTSRKDRILAVVRRVKAQEPEIQEEVKRKVREAMQNSRGLDEEESAATFDAASSPWRDA